MLSLFAFVHGQGRKHNEKEDSKLWRQKKLHPSLLFSHYQLWNLDESFIILAVSFLFRKMSIIITTLWSYWIVRDNVYKVSDT